MLAPSNLSLCVQVHIEDCGSRRSNWTATFSVRRRAFYCLERASRQAATLGVAAAALGIPLIYALAVVLHAMVVRSRRLDAQTAALSPLEPSPLLRQVAKEVVAKTMLVHLHCASPVSLLDPLCMVDSL